MDTSNVEIIKNIEETRISIVFKGDLTDTLYYFMIISDNKNEIEFMGHKSELVDRKTFDADGEQVEILKYRYDLEDGVDEELDFYLTADGDVLGFRELAWNGYEIFLQDKNLQILKLLTSDTTDFFKYNYRFHYL
ncbi:MAG TPA: hypothetical protein VD884_12950 [Ohtaekwangia sp.]|nr:hypothetical protein [Ohtaekwangia sp.]